jgi:TolB-like protein
MLLISMPLMAQQAGGDASATKLIALMDISSSSFTVEKSRILTDYLRTELFKTKIFRIVERGALQQALIDLKTEWKGEELTALQVGKNLGLDKVMLCAIEKFGDTLAVTVKIIDVKQSVLDWSESTFVKAEDQIFDTFKTVASRLVSFYKTSLSIAQADASDDPDKRLAAGWTFLGAQGADLDYLLAGRIQTDEFLDLRQYDIAFLPRDYAQLKRQGTDVNIILAFLQAGISYELAKKAIGLGITKIDRWRESFAPQGFSFADFLEAYQSNMLTPEEYKQYRATFRKDFFVVGLGGVADAFPVSTAQTKFPLAQASWERFWTPNLRQFFKFSTTAGVYGMWLVLPVPFVSMNAYLGYYPYYLKVGVGGHTELIVGGHTGISANLGFELLERFELDTFWILAGTQPTVTYTDWNVHRGDPGYYELKFPFIGVFFTYKF